MGGEQWLADILAQAAGQVGQGFQRGVAMTLEEKARRRQMEAQQGFAAGEAEKGRAFTAGQNALYKETPAERAARAAKGGTDLWGKAMVHAAQSGMPEVGLELSKLGQPTEMVGPVRPGEAQPMRQPSPPSPEDVFSAYQRGYEPAYKRIATQEGAKAAQRVEAQTTGQIARENNPDLQNAKVKNATNLATARTKAGEDVREGYRLTADDRKNINALQADIRKAKLGRVQGFGGAEKTQAYVAERQAEIAAIKSGKHQSSAPAAPAAPIGGGLQSLQPALPKAPGADAVSRLRSAKTQEEAAAIADELEKQGHPDVAGALRESGWMK